MKRIVTLGLLALLGAMSVAPAFGKPGSAGRRARTPFRTPIVIAKAHPIRRDLPIVLLRPARVKIVRPAKFLAPTVWSGKVVEAPKKKNVIWSDTGSLKKKDDWTDFTMVCDRPGQALIFNVDGTAQIEFVEIVFGKGETQVVDFKRWTPGTKNYLMHQLANRRKVDHVRVVARARSEEAKLTVKLLS